MPIQSAAQPSAAGERGARQLRRVVLLRQVRRDDVLQPRACRCGRGAAAAASLCRWPKRPGDALLQRIRIAAAGEHVEIVVALEHQRVAAGEARLDVRRDVPMSVSTPSRARAVGDDELHRLARVVRHRERRDLERADRERVVAVEAVDARRCRRGGRPTPASVPKVAQTAMPWRAANAGTPPTWSRVLVGDEDRGERSPARARGAPSRAAVSRTPNPQSIITRVPPASTTRPLPSLPLPSDAKRIGAVASASPAGRTARGGHYFSWSFSSARIFSPLGLLSGAPSGSCTVTTLRGVGLRDDDPVLLGLLALVLPEHQLDEEALVLLAPGVRDRRSGRSRGPCERSRSTTVKPTRSSARPDAAPGAVERLVDARAAASRRAPCSMRARSRAGATVGACGDCAARALGRAEACTISRVSNSASSSGSGGITAQAKPAGDTLSISPWAPAPCRGG